LVEITETVSHLHLTKIRSCLILNPQTVSKVEDLET
jgi:hypothetical protein